MFLTLACFLGLLLLIGTSLISRVKNINPKESMIGIKVEEQTQDEDQFITSEDRERQTNNLKQQALDN